MRHRLLAVLAVSATLLGCQTIAPASRTVDPETLPNCTRACKQVGMKLSGIVFVQEMGGCVCEPEAAPPKAAERAEAGSRTANGAGAAASGALVLVLAAQAAQQEGSQRSNPSIPSIPSVPSIGPR
jgi:hypothetical protein